MTLSMRQLVTIVCIVCINFSCSRGIHHQLRFLRPRCSGQILGGVTHLSVLAESNDGELVVNNASIALLEFVLVVNDQAVHNAPALNSLFECVLLESALSTGWNSLLIQLRTGEGKVVATDNVAVFRSHLRGVMTGGAQTAPGMRDGNGAVLMAGVGPDTIARLARTDPVSLTILDAAGDHACDVLGSPKFVRCASPRNPWDALRSPAYDRAYISYTGLRAIAQSTNITNQNAFLGKFLQSMVRMTHGEVWFWAPEGQGVLPDSLLSADACGSSTCFERINLESTTGKQEIQGEYETMEDLLSATAEDDLSRTGHAIYRLNIQAYQSMREHSHADSQPAAGQHQLSSIVRADWRVGRVHVHIRNACLLRDGRTLVAMADESTDNNTRQRSEWEDLWDKAAASEDFGFQYTSLLIRKLSVLRNAEGKFKYWSTNASICAFNRVVLCCYSRRVPSAQRVLGNGDDGATLQCARRAHCTSD